MVRRSIPNGLEFVLAHHAGPPSLRLHAKHTRLLSAMPTHLFWGDFVQAAGSCRYRNIQTIRLEIRVDVGLREVDGPRQFVILHRLAAQLLPICPLEKPVILHGVCHAIAVEQYCV